MAILPVYRLVRKIMNYSWQRQLIIETIQKTKEHMTAAQIYQLTRKSCPHLSLQQLKDWTDRLETALKANGRTKVCVPTVFTTAPGVGKAFDATPYAARLAATGVILSCICPLMYMNNPLCASMPVITCSNKLRTYTTARYYTEDEILTQITKGGARA